LHCKTFRKNSAGCQSETRGRCCLRPANRKATYETETTFAEKWKPRVRYRTNLLKDEQTADAFRIQLTNKTAPLGPQNGIRRATHRRPTACKPRATHSRPSAGIPRATTTAFGGLNTAFGCLGLKTAFDRNSPSNASQAYGLQTPSDALPAFGRHSVFHILWYCASRCRTRQSSCCCSSGYGAGSSGYNVGSTSNYRFEE